MVVEVAGRTMLMRGAPAEVRGRVWASLEGVFDAWTALGALPVLGMVALAGAGLALVAYRRAAERVTLVTAKRYIARIIPHPRPGRPRPRRPRPLTA